MFAFANAAAEAFDTRRGVFIPHDAFLVAANAFGGRPIPAPAYKGSLYEAAHTWCRNAYADLTCMDTMAPCLHAAFDHARHGMALRTLAHKLAEAESRDWLRVDVTFLQQNIFT